MAFACCKRFLFLHFCWSLTMTSDNFNDNEIEHLEGNVLRISCGVINGASVSNPIQVSIFEDTPNNTLVSIVYEMCPKVQDSDRDQNIHLAKCVKHGENMLVDTRLANYNPTGHKHFGCNYKYLVGDSQTSNDMPLATVSIPENSSPAASSENESPTTPEGHSEVTEERDDKSIVVHGETCGIQDTLSLVLNTVNCALLLVIVYKKCWKSKPKLNCCHVCPCGKTAQAQSKTSEYSEHDEHEDEDGYTTINKPPKRDNSHKCTEDNELISSPENVSKMSVRIKSRNLSPETVNGEREYQDGISCTQVKKLPRSETCVHIPLMY